MNPMLLGGIFDIASKVFDRIFPNPEEKAKAQLELLKMQQAGDFKQLEADLQLALGQIETNKVEAASENIFKSGWRPFIGWVCGGGLFYQLMGAPLLGWAASNLWQWSPPPSLEMDTLMTLLFGMLGLGALRTKEKITSVKK